MMKLNIVCLLFIGFFMQISNADEGKDVIIKIHVPTSITKQVNKISDNKLSQEVIGANYGTDYTDNYSGEYSPSHGNYFAKQKNSGVDKHEPKYTSYNPGSTHNYKSGYKSGKKVPSKYGYKSNDNKINQNKKEYGKGWYDDFKKQRDSYKVNPIEYNSETNSQEDYNSNPYFDDGFKKSVQSEHYEVKKINPNAKFPDEKVIIQGSYKVKETDPFDFTKTAVHSYDSPISKIAAQILSNYDGDFESYPYSHEKGSDSYKFSGEKEKKKTDYDTNVSSEDSNDKPSLGYYEALNDSGDNTNHYDDYGHGKYESGYPSYPSYDGKKVEHFILHQVYGNEYAPSNKAVQKVKPDKIKRNKE